ncbi:MAG: PEP-CTERM sorting domain-containing protein [Propionivibrio sp.]|nr:PEP-CTERM sorting domain-containing protein [Propionivibrio sp.]
MSDLALPSQDVTLTATVNNYANALFGKVSGAGTLSNTGSQFILNFGNVVQGSAALQATLNIENAVAGPADLLNGGLALVDGDDFASTLLLTAFSDVVAGGNSGNALSFLFNSATLGAFQDVVTLSWFGHNGSGYQDQAQLYTLLVQGNVIQSNGTVPEPGTLLLLALALAGLLLQRRYAVLH